MSYDSIQFLNKLSQHQNWLSTWEINYCGKNCLARVLKSGDNSMGERTRRILERQIRLHNSLLPEHRQQIILFNHKVESMMESEPCTLFLREWVDGDSLDSLLPDSPMLWQEAVTQIEAIAQVMEIAHNQYSLCHGDLKPSNIVVDSSENMRIIDWDSMQLIGEYNHLNDNTISIESIGTPYYMAPEQCSGQTCDMKCDVYALGVIFYRLLTGKVPFEEMNTLNLWTKKQTTPIISILSEHAALCIPTEIGLLVDKTLKIDQNLRIQTVSDFLSRLRAAAQAADPAAFLDFQDGSDTFDSANHSFVSVTNFPTYSPAGVPEEKPQEEEDHSIPKGEIVLIGHTQAGKTVLAAGLYSTSDTAFSVTPMDEASKTFAANMKSTLMERHWPAATSKGQVENLRFIVRLKENGIRRAAIVNFKEYAGERMNSQNYFDEIIGKPDGVLLLINPGAFESRNSREREDVIVQMKSSISYLASLPQRPFVALVTTASDRLEGDLMFFEPTFRKLTMEIVDALSLSGLVWKPFEVSVCRTLENQQTPELDPQNIKDPFIWLLNRQRAMNRNKFLMRVAKYTAIVVTCLLILFFWWKHLDYTQMSQIEKEMAQVEKQYVSRTSESVKLQYTTALESLIAKFPEKKLWFRKHTEMYDDSRHDLLNRTDNAKNDWFTYRIEHPSNPALPLESFTNISREIYQWETYLKENQKFKTALKTTLVERMPRYLELCPDWLAQSKGDEFLSHYDTIQKFVEQGNFINNDLKPFFQSKIVPLKTNVLRERIRNFSGSKEQLNAFIVECSKHVERDMEQPFAEVELGKELFKLADEKISKLINDCLFNGILDADSIRFYQSCISDWEFKETDKKNLITKLKSVEKDFIDNFLKTVNGTSAIVALGKLKPWLLENHGKMFETSRAEQVVYEIAERDAINLRKKCADDYDKKNYNNMKTLCYAITASPSKVIQNSKLFQFANAYPNWYENNRKMKVTMTDCCITSNDPTYTGSIINFGLSLDEKTLTSSLDLEPWEELNWYAEVNFKDGGNFYFDSQASESWSMNVSPGEICKTCTVKNAPDLDVASVEITFNFRIEGISINALWIEVFNKDYK